MGFPTSTQAEYLSMVRCKIPLHRLFCYLFRPLHRRNEVEKIQLLHRLNEVSVKWRSVSFTDAVVHCPDFGSKSKVSLSRPSPHNLWETTRGPRRWSIFYFILTLNKKLIKKVVFTDKFDDDIQKVTPARAPLAFSFAASL
ncbi:hypothetical protein TNCV_1105831 [Trichonephila clavipes]|nr:hypothetical protein TNCV_1105831 [Trichonephila clavipes]